MKIKFNLLLYFVIIITSFQARAHPGGNMIIVGKHVLWSYVSPINDIGHQACVMIWSPGSKPEIILKSKYVASDYMLFSNGNDIFIIEQRYIQVTNKYEIRILKTEIDGEPFEIWGWFEDKWRIGDGGFFMKSDKEIIFGRYPSVYRLKKGQTPVEYLEFNFLIKKIRAVDNNQVLLLNDNSCYLIDQEGKIIKEWTNITDSNVDNISLNRNQIFDADFKNEELLVAYWGKRSFDLYRRDGSRKTLMQMQAPFVPHWVAFYENKELLFSSKLVFTGETPKPNLILYKSDNEKINIWKN